MLQQQNFKKVILDLAYTFTASQEFPNIFHFRKLKFEAYSKKTVGLESLGEMEANKCLKMGMIESNMEDIFKAMNRLIEAVNKRSSGEKIPTETMDGSATMKSIAEHFISLMEKVKTALPEQLVSSLKPSLFTRALTVDMTIQNVVVDGSREEMRTANEFLVGSRSYCNAIEEVVQHLQKN